MADLYGTNARSSSLESEDMSSLLRNLLHNSFTSPPSSSASFKDKHKQSFITPSSPPPLGYTDCRFREGISTAGSSVMVDSLTGFNFSDPGRGLRVDAEDCTRNTFSSVCAVDSDGLTPTLKRKFPAENDAEDFGFDCKKGTVVSEAPVDPSPPRSSKRSRAAEFHNLSEKRRRSKINEKVKALQNLIPNSNKTDKASVLDEAIEYLKQLQQQVQMLSMRNGQSLHPFCLSGSLHPTQLPQPGIGFDEGNELLNAKGEYTFFGNQGVSMQAAFDLPNQCSPSNQPNLISPMTNIPSSDTSFVLESSVQNHYGPFNHLTSSKEIFRGDRLSQLQLDMSCFPKNSSSGVSS